MSRVIRRTAWSLFLVLCFCSSFLLFPAEDPPSNWEVEIMVFSGLPNPVFTLLQSEWQEVQRFISEASGTTEHQTWILPSKLGYSGLFIKQRGTGLSPFEKEVLVDNFNLSVIQVAGKSILLQNRAESRLKQAPDDRLEQYLVDLALARGVIDDNVYQWIQKDMQKR
jgi:hypothetical protein